MSEAKPIEHGAAETGPITDNVVELAKRTPAEHGETAIKFVKEHSGLAIVGGVAVGVLVALLLPRRRNKVSRRSAALVDAIGATAATLGRQALKRAESASSEVRREGGRAARHSEELGATIAKQVGAFLHNLLEQAEDVGETAADQAGKVSKLAVKGFSKASEAAEDAAAIAGDRIGKTVAKARNRIIG